MRPNKKKNQGNSKGSGGGKTAKKGEKEPPAEKLQEDDKKPPPKPTKKRFKQIGKKSKQKGKSKGIDVVDDRVLSYDSDFMEQDEEEKDTDFGGGEGSVDVTEKKAFSQTTRSMDVEHAKESKEGTQKGKEKTDQDNEDSPNYDLSQVEVIDVDAGDTSLDEKIRKRRLVGMHIRRVYGNDLVIYDGMADFLLYSVGEFEAETSAQTTKYVDHFGPFTIVSMF